jgi:threonyl-tRNA synthetase
MSQNENHDSPLYKIRHSLAHVLAQAVQQFRPGTKLGFGPPIEDGFYYDFILPEPINEEDFPAIEKIMKHIIAQNQKFEFKDLPAQEAFSQIDKMGEPYKREYAQDLVNKHGLKELRFYSNGQFIDMCEGPHVDNTNKLPKGAFKIKSVAGAYWRGNSDNQMMTRLYVWAFETKEELDEVIKSHKLALERDHKKLGKDLDLFHIDDEVGKGLPLWMPNGAVIRDELEKLMVEMEFKNGYQRVHTPEIAKTSLYYQTGHLPYYKDGMFPFMSLQDRSVDHQEEGAVATVEEYVLKPMNCPHHHKIFHARPKSYRDLPLRLAEYGHCYRYEDSGACSGILRVRGMTMNDAHIYCTEEQIKTEFLAVMKMHKDLYDLFGFKNYHMRLSTWDPEDPKGKEKYVNNPAAWEKTTNILKEAMEESGLPYIIGKGEGAFYGPKIDFQFKTVTGREETASTNQLDFAVPERLGLTYIGADNKPHTPYVIHRAPAGTHERFVAFLIEHFGGAFPTWIAPVQVKVLVVSEKFNEYAEKIVKDLRHDFVRAEIDLTDDSFNKKIRNNAKKKIPNILIVGEKEMLDQTVTLKRYGIEEQSTMSYEGFKKMLFEKIKTRALE